MKSRTLLAGLLMFGSLTLSGCQPVQAVLTPEPEIVTEEATVAVPAAQVQGELPSGLPADVPIWPGSKVVDPEAGEDGAVTFVLETPDPYDVVLPGLSVGLERAGWEAVESLSEDSASALDISNGSYQGILTLTKSDAGTAIEYFLMESAD